MKVTDFPKVYRDALAYWCAFRNLGFNADEIYFGFGVVSGHPDCVFLQLQTQGKDFTCTVGELRGAPEADVHAVWQQVADLVNESNMEELEACYAAHRIGTDLLYFATFVSAIRNKGIVVPELTQEARNAHA